MQTICVLGATGSIGDSALDVIARHPERYQVVALTAHSQWEKLARLCERFQPKVAVMTDPEAALKLEQALPDLTVLAGSAVLDEAVKVADTVITGIVGAAGLGPTLTAAKLGKRILLANKEPLVCAGQLVMQAVANSGATLLPLDSEHNAIFQSLPNGKLTAGVSKLILTASGGPFLKTPLAELVNVTPDQACKHPNWVMGRKISVDSASMMNKGLEVIEAHWLFAAPAAQIEVVIHPQSIIHSMVQYVDGSVVAQLGRPDMRTPIAHALAYPERIDSGVAPLDFTQCPPLQFEKPDLERSPCLRLAYEALALGGLYPAVLNAANEVAVARFLNHEIRFTDIPRLIERALEQTESRAVYTLSDITEIDRMTRQRCNEYHLL
jgi:1-deoxy-D-xylulose-5-phosphate reductoisomerase